MHSLNPSNHPSIPKNKMIGIFWSHFTGFLSDILSKVILITAIASRLLDSYEKPLNGMKIDTMSLSNLDSGASLGSNPIPMRRSRISPTTTPENLLSSLQDSSLIALRRSKNSILRGAMNSCLMAVRNSLISLVSMIARPGLNSSKRSSEKISADGITNPQPSPISIIALIARSDKLRS